MALVSYQPTRFIEDEELCKDMLEQSSVTLDGDEYQIVDSYHNRVLDKILLGEVYSQLYIEPFPIKLLGSIEDMVNKKFGICEKEMHCPLVYPQGKCFKDAIFRLVKEREASRYYYYVEKRSYSRYDKLIRILRTTDIIRSIVITSKKPIGCQLLLCFSGGDYVICHTFTQLDETTCVMTIQIPILSLPFSALMLDVTTEDSYEITYYLTLTDQKFRRSMTHRRYHSLLYITDDESDDDKN